MPLTVFATSAFGRSSPARKRAKVSRSAAWSWPSQVADLPAERFDLPLEIAESQDLVGRLVGLELVPVDDDPEPPETLVGGRLEGFPVLSLLELPVAGHHDHDAPAAGKALGQRDPAALGDAHAERPRVRLDTRHADIRMPVEPAEASQPDEPLGGENAEPVERGVQARDVVTLRGEEDVPLGVVEPELGDVQLRVEEMDDDVERAEARAEVPRSRALDRDEGVQTADVGDQREPCVRVAVRSAEPIDVRLRDEGKLRHAARR